MLGEYRGSDDSLDRLTSTTPCKRPYDYDPRGDRFLAVMRNESPRSLVLVQGLGSEVERLFPEP